MKLLSLMTLSLFVSACSLLGNNPIVTLTTNNYVGDKITFKLATNQLETDVKIDYGDGVLVEYKLSDYLEKITGTVQGENIKIYGKRNVLTTFYCGNEKLTSLSFANCSALKELYCFQNRLMALDVTGSPALETLFCYNNELTTLDLGNNLALTNISCGFNQLLALDLTKQVVLTELYCAGNQLTVLDITNNTSVENLFCHQNKLTELDLTQNSRLSILNCNKNQLSALDLSHNTLLKTLDCANNVLLTLELANHPKLSSLSCNDNRLMALDLTSAVALRYLNCSKNQLSSISGIEHTKLNDYSCNGNRLTFASLPPQKKGYDKPIYVFYWPQQQLPIDKTIAVGGAIDLSAESKVNTTSTTFTWKTADGRILKNNQDYKINNGITTFIRAQAQPVYCEMENEVFPRLVLTTSEIVVGAN